MDNSDIQNYSRNSGQVKVDKFWWAGGSRRKYVSEMYHAQWNGRIGDKSHVKMVPYRFISGIRLFGSGKVKLDFFGFEVITDHDQALNVPKTIDLYRHITQ